MDLLTGVDFSARGIVAAVLISAILMVPASTLAQDPMVGAKVAIDSNGAVEVNNVKVYTPGDNLYAESGQIMTDSSGQEEEESWYTPTWGKFAIGLAAIGVGVGIYFIVDNNIDRDDDGYWYYDADCDCWRYHD